MFCSLPNVSLPSAEIPVFKAVYKASVLKGKSCRQGRGRWTKFPGRVSGRGCQKVLWRWPVAWDLKKQLFGGLDNCGRWPLSFSSCSKQSKDKETLKQSPGTSSEDVEWNLRLTSNSNSCYFGKSVLQAGWGFFVFYFFLTSKMSTGLDCLQIPFHSDNSFTSQCLICEELLIPFM